jgi:RNA polymerase sigma factor (TIGR02999 family)
MVRDDVQSDPSADTPSVFAGPDQRLDSSPSAGDVTRILAQFGHSDGQATERLLPIVYDELRRLAAQKMGQEQPGQTLQATGLVHEAYVRLVDVEKVQHWDSRGHFFAAAVEAMRRILVENARSKRRLKRGRRRQRLDLDQLTAGSDPASDDLLALDEALTKLAMQEPSKAELVRLRYFAGFTIDEAAELLGISRATAKRNWAYARAWLFAEISDPEDSSQES